MTAAPSPLERATARVAYQCLLWTARLAKLRGDDHEAAHCGAALAVANTGPHHEPCTLGTHTGAGAVTELAHRLGLRGAIPRDTTGDPSPHITTLVHADTSQLRAATARLAYGMSASAVLSADLTGDGATTNAWRTDLRDWAYTAHDLTEEPR